MNSTYKKELSSSIKNSNKEFVKEEYKLDHKKNASKVSLYYAHGQTEKTHNNFISTREDSKAAEKLNKKVVKATNFTENVVLAAKQSLQDSSSTTSNVSTAAANMQIAANAITKLASDVAALKSVAKNTANESKILHHTNKANELIQHAAKKAEEVSLVSMQATIEAAQATASTVVTNAEASLEAVKSLHSSTAANYSNLQELTVTDNENLTTARKNEKLASAKFDITKRQDMAIKATRRQVNKVSNHHLTMKDPQVKKNKGEHAELWPFSEIPAGDSYTIRFESYDNEEHIKNYRLIVAKYDDAEAFDINIAKDLDPGTYYQFAPAAPNNSKKRAYSHTFYLLDAKEHAIPNHHFRIVEDGKKWHIQDNSDGMIELMDNVVTHLAVDYKGKPLERGTPYVAYVYAVYEENYQRTIDSTVGDLSQPSKKLTLQQYLYSPDKVSMYNPYFNSRNIAVSFQLPIEHYDPMRIEYRIMAVESVNVMAKEINHKIQKAIDVMEIAEYQYNAANNKLSEYTARYNELRVRYISLSNQIEEQEANPDPNVDLEELKKQQAETKGEQDDMEKLIEGHDDQPGQRAITQKAQKAYKKAKDDEDTISRTKINDFIFDDDLMATVKAADYTVADPIKWTLETAGIKYIESWIDYEKAKFNLSQLLLNAEPDEVKNLKTKYGKQLGKVESAESALVNLESTFVDLDNELKEAKKKKKSKEEIEAIESKLNIAEDDLRKGKASLKSEQNKLQDLARQIEVAEEQQSDVTPQHITSLVEKMIKMKYEMGMYLHILKLLLTNYFERELIELEDKLADLVDQLLNHFDLKDQIEKIAKLLEEGKDVKVVIPPKSFEYEEEVLPLVLMYTELGDDATDNYGEPLFQNQSDFISNAIADFADVIKKDEADREERFDELVEQYDPQEMKNKLLESPRITYKAVVYASLTAAYAADVKEYKNTHSEFSEGNTVIYKTQ